MKKIRFSKVIAALISALMLLTFLASCATSMGEPLMTLENKTITVNMYRLWLSRVKGGYGGVNNGIWDEVSADGRTYNEIFTGFVKQNAMTFLSAMYEFDKLGLKLPQSEIDAIDKTMKSMLSERADGSREELNSLLSSFGVNYDILREIYVIEAKLAYLKDYLYGSAGKEIISDTVKDEYFTSNYVRIKQIFLYTSNKPVTDEEGNFTYDEAGNVITRDFSESEIADQKEKAKQIMTALASGQDFELLMASQNEDRAASSYPNGYYFTRSANYVEEVIEGAFELQDGEYKMVESEYGIHIIRRLPLEEKGYTLSVNKDFFTDFEENLETEVFTARLSKYEDKIKINEDLLSKYDIKNSAANTSY